MAACCQAVVTTFLAAGVQNLKFDLLWAALPLVGILLLGAVILSWAKQWRNRGEAATSTANDQLAQFRSLYERGELKKDEFERIRAHLADQLRQELEARTGEEPLEVTSLASPTQTEKLPDPQTPPHAPDQTRTEKTPPPEANGNATPS